MNRFVKFRLIKDAGSLENVAQRASLRLVSHEHGEGFEIKELTKKTLHLAWVEKISIPKKTEDDVFGELSYQEVKVLRFDLIFPQDLKSVILINPPSAKHKFHRVLRMLMESSNWGLQSIKVFETIARLTIRPEWSLVAIQTEEANMGNGMFVSVGVSGKGDLSKYLDKLKFGVNFVIRAAWFDYTLPTGISRVSITKSGLIRISKDLTAVDILKLSNHITYE